jgi:integrase/recombinase XerD
LKDLFKEYENHLKENTKKSKNTVDSYLRDLDKFTKYLDENNGSEDLLSVKKTNILSYIIHLQNKSRKSATLARVLSSLRYFYDYCMNSKLIDYNPCYKVKTPKVESKKTDYLSEDEVIKLIEKPNLNNYYGLRDRAMLELMYSTGMKVSEIVELKMEDYKGKGPYMLVGDDRVLPIGRTANDFLQKYIEENRSKLKKGKESKYIFLNKSGKRLSRQGFWKKIKKYAKEANIKKNITPQVIRNTFALHLLNNGASLQAVSQMLGHNSIQTTQQYLKSNEIKILDEFHNSHPRA